MNFIFTWNSLCTYEASIIFLQSKFAVIEINVMLLCFKSLSSHEEHITLENSQHAITSICDKDDKDVCFILSNVKPTAFCLVLSRGPQRRSSNTLTFHR